MTRSQSGNVWTAVHGLDPGRYEYKFIVNGEWIQDLSNPDQTSDGYEGFNSVLTIACDAHLEVVSSSSSAEEGTLSATLRLTPEDATLDTGAVVVTLDHQPVSWEAAGNDISVELSDVTDGIHDLRVQAGVVGGAATPTVLLKFYLNLSSDWRETIIYFAMTDRFRNGNPSNDNPISDVDDRVNWQGGDFEGLRQSLVDGYFDDLGVNAIWLSWPVQNLNGYEQGDRPSEHGCHFNADTIPTTETRYTAYHGYWPVDSGEIEPRFGTLEELQAFVDEAHSRGIRVLLDYTANHVHTASAFFSEHQYEYFNWPDSGQHHVCQDVGWDTEPETCWFTPYLADLDYRNPDAVDTMVDMAFEWIVSSGADGFRVDAVKHINREFLRVLRQRITDEIELTSIPFYLVGETFTHDAGLIASFVGDDLLYGQFDFPLNQQILKAFATQEIDLNELDTSARGIKAVYGDAIMSNFIGNHDLARFISLAAGDIHCGVWNVLNNIAQGWLLPPDAPSDDLPHERLRLAFTYIMTIPGIPLIYYGDEFGIPGAGDPDNRRMMRFAPELNTRENATLAFLRRLGTVRADHPVLSSGDWGATIVAEPDLLVYPRVSDDEDAIIVINRGSTSRTLDLSVSGSGIADGTSFRDALSDSAALLTANSGRLSVTVQGRSAAIFVSE